MELDIRGTAIEDMPEEIRQQLGWYVFQQFAGELFLNNHPDDWEYAWDIWLKAIQWHINEVQKRISRN